MDKIREEARKLMGPRCKVCKVCNGIACAGEVPGMGGLGTAASFKNNFKALAQVHFNMRLIHDVVEPDTCVKLFGKELALPVFAAPIGGVSFNMNEAISEEAYINSIVDGCKAKSILGCTGDGVPEFIHQAGFSAIKNAGGFGIPFIKPWEDDEFYKKVELAKETGTDIIGMDIDAAGLITLRKMGRPVSPKPVDVLARMVKDVGLKFILKGVMTKEDASLAIEAGVDGIVVSNHGGRVLDHTPGVAEVLPEITEVVKGAVTVLADGGVRTGGDVLKLLALGADGVMIGRPFSVAAVGGLQEGVEKYIDQLHGELKQAMVLTGVGAVEDVDRGIIRF